jgi:hypothetical protein
MPSFHPHTRPAAPDLRRDTIWRGGAPRATLGLTRHGRAGSRELRAHEQSSAARTGMSRDVRLGAFTEEMEDCTVLLGPTEDLQ